MEFMAVQQTLNPSVIEQHYVCWIRRMEKSSKVLLYGWGCQGGHPKRGPGLKMFEKSGSKLLGLLWTVKMIRIQTELKSSCKMFLLLNFFSSFKVTILEIRGFI